MLLPSTSQSISLHRAGVRKPYGNIIVPGPPLRWLSTPLFSPQKGFASIPEAGCSWGEEEHRRQSYSPASSAAVYIEFESFEMLFLAAGRRYTLQNCQKTRLESRLERQKLSQRPFRPNISRMQSPIAIFSWGHMKDSNYFHEELIKRL